MSDTDTTEERSKERERDRGRRERNLHGENTRDRSRDRGREPRSMKSSLNRVYVSNIPYEYRWQDVKDLFRNEVGDVQFVELFFDDNDKPKGCGIVEFSDGASVKKCVEVMQRYEVKGRKLVIKEDIGVMRDRHGAIIGSGSRRGDRYRDRESNLSMRNDEGKWGNTYGLSVQFLESLKIDPPISNKVFVANLQYNVDKKKLKEAFKLAGKVISVEIPLDKDGRSRGFAVIEFDHPVEAVQAISMFHNQVYFDRTITVRMDRASEVFKLPEGLRSVGMGLGPNGEPLKCVAHNLPSLSSTSQQSNSLSSGLLGSVPNNFQLANALSGLGTVGSLSGLNQQVLQAANFSGLATSLLGQGLGNTDLSFQNPLTNTTSQQLAALAVQNTASNYSRSRDGSGDFAGYDNQSSCNDKYNGVTNTTSNKGYQNINYGSTLPFTNYDTGRLENKSLSRKVLISNLPSNVSYKLLSEKFSEYGDVVSFEAKTSGSLVLTYGSEWQAERAIKNLDKARVDGRMIEARLFY